MRKNLLEVIDSDSALQLLQTGNRYFIQNIMHISTDAIGTRSELDEKGQRPFAVILGCSDSRVTPEIIFNTGLGQLFVVRTAGNVADAIAIGSVEYAVEHLHSPLVVVLGHQKCGAVAAAVSGGEFSPNIEAIVAEIQPSLEKVRMKETENIACHCEDENIRHTISRLKSSQILSEAIAGGKLKIIGAKYNMETGVVDFRED